MDCFDSEAKSNENVEATSSLPLSDYAKKLDQRVKKRYEDKIAAIGIDPVLLEGKHFEPDCLPPVEATDTLSYLVLETSYYMQKQFKALEVSGHTIRWYRDSLRAPKGTLSETSSLFWQR